MKDIKLGVIAEDKITGFKGIVTAHVKYLTGCDQYCLRPKVNDKGELQEGMYFDGGQLEVIGEGILESDVQGDEKGGPNMNAPSR